MNPTQITISLLFLQAAQFTSATLCYTPDGTISNDVPCNATADVSVCCSEGFVCTSNLLCQPKGWWDGTDGSPLQFIRGTCTDKAWSSSLCPGRCVAESVSGGEWVMRCGNTTNEYCCSAEDCCSNKSFARFPLDEPTVTATAGVIPSTTANTASTTSSQTTTSTSTTSSPAQTTSSDSSGDGSSHSHSKTIGIGVGVGVGVGVVILGLLVGFLLMRQRKARNGVPPYNAQDPRVFAELQGRSDH